jgi:Ras GTPase-activating-like protein IQGAP2/3
MLVPSTFSVRIGSLPVGVADQADLQELRFLCVETVKGLVNSTVQLPYTVKMLARETLLALRVRQRPRLQSHALMKQIKYPDAYDEDLTPIIARTVVLPFILPALMCVQ